jgi:hypothetical protein
MVDTVDLDESAELSEMADLRELNDLKSRILNGTNWRSQVLKKTVQEINHSSGGGDVLLEEPPNELANDPVNGVARKYDIKSSEIKTLKLKEAVSEVDGASGPIKVKDIISKFQGLQSPKSSLSDSRDKWNHQQSISLNDGHHEEESDSETSEDDSVTEEEEEEDEEEPYAEKPNDINQQNGFRHHTQEPVFNKQTAMPHRIQPLPANYQNVPHNNVESEILPPPLMPKLLDTRSLIPKDAYFHELPHKFQLLRPITDNVPQTQANFPFQQVPNVHGGRNRNPIPIDLNDAEITKTNAAALVAHNLSYSHHSSVPLEIPQFQQYTTDHHMQQYTPNPHQLYNNYPPHFLPPSANVNGHMPIISQPLNMVYSRPPLKVVPQKEKLLSNRKFGYTNLVDMELTRLNPSETSSAEGSTSTTFSNHLQLLDHVQYERDKNNDSGYSTKICGSSQGASPSLSGHMDSIENPDNIQLSHHHHQHHHPSTAYNGHHHHPMHLPPHPKLMSHPMQQPQHLPPHPKFNEDLYLSNVGSSSLV